MKHLRKIWEYTVYFNIEHHFSNYYYCKRLRFMLVVCEINIKIEWWLDSIMQPITWSQSSLEDSGRKDGASTHIHQGPIPVGKKAKCLSPGLPLLPNAITYGQSEKRDRGRGKRRAVNQDCRKWRENCWWEEKVMEWRTQRNGKASSK